MIHSAFDSSTNAPAVAASTQRGSRPGVALRQCARGAGHVPSLTALLLATCATLGLATGWLARASASESNEVAPPGGVPTSVDLSPQSLDDFQVLNFTPLPGFQAPAWALSEDAFEVEQTNNSQPTVFVSDFDLDGGLLEVELLVDTMGDGDAVGIALGVEPGDNLDFSANWWLIDWRRTKQTFDFPGGTAGGAGEVGLALSEVTGVPSADAFWSHQSVGANGLNELARGANLGAAPWKPGQLYALRLEFREDHLRLWVDGVLELDVAADFSAAFDGGRLGLYNFSQSGATYRIDGERVNASWSLYGEGTSGTLGVPGFSLAADPQIGTAVAFQLENSFGAETDACLVLTGAPADVETTLGRLLLDLPFVKLYVLHPFPAEGATVFLNVPPDPAFIGIELYAQYLLTDPGSTTGKAWSRGMHLVLGV